MAVRRVFVGITGASGSIYAVRLVEELTRLGIGVELCASPMGEQVLAYEVQGMSSQRLARQFGATRYRPNDLFAPPSSGSNAPDATVIAPTSMSTLGNIANATGSNLVHRVADVALKERRPLVLLVREMPYSLLHLRNMVAVTEAGGIVLPASPGFYHHPERLEDLVNFVVGKTLDLIGVEHQVSARWAREPERAEEGK